MRRRLAASYLMLLVLVLVALEVPLCVTLASQSTQRLAADRLADAIRFSTLAEPALRTGESVDLEYELGRYSELYGIGSAVVDADGRGVVAFPADLDLANSYVLRQSRRALAGQQAADDGRIWPWRSTPLVVAVPVGSGGENIGAVVVVSSVRETANALSALWTALVAGGLLVLATAIVAARYFARWTLRPVAELDAAVNEIGAGNYQVRAPAHLGPPELRRLANAFNEMTVIITELLERQRSFVSHASHQLRNPLTALRLRVEELGEDIVGDAAREGHRLALEETQRLCQVLDSLLALARADRGQSRLEKVDPAEIAAARVRAWRPVADLRGVALSYLPPPEPVRVYTVVTALDQSLDALIDNAVKFSNAGCGVVVRVDAVGSPATAGAGGTAGVAVHVIDDGPGLTAEQRKQALERFWRAPDMQNVAGSGLGLPIVSVLVEASGGRLDLLPANPNGLDACIWLPAVEP